MNEYIVIYQTPDAKEKRAAIDDFYRERDLNMRRLNENWPHIVHIDSELDTAQFADTLRTHSMNHGAILFSVNQTVHV